MQPGLVAAAVTKNKLQWQKRSPWQQRNAAGSQQSHHPIYWRRRHRSGYLARQCSGIWCSRTKAYGGTKKIEWMKVLAGEEAFNKTGEWMPEETMQAFKEYLISIKGLLTTGWRWYPQPQCSLTPGTGSVRLPQARKIFWGSTLSMWQPEKSEHGDLPWEHRRYLCRNRIHDRNTGS